MEDYNQEEQQSEEINGENIEYSEEILKSDSIECPNCKKLEKIVLETLRRTESFKVKPFEIMVCKNCGNVFCDVDEISNTL